MRKAVARVAILTTVLWGGAASACAAPTYSGGYRLGLNFVEDPYQGPIEMGALDGEGQVDQMFYPVQITEPFSNGAMAGWTEAAIRSAIVLTIEDVYRAVDTGDPATTLAVQFYANPLSSNPPGRRLNVIFGRNQSVSSNSLGSASFTGAAFSSASLPNGSDGVAVYVDHLNQLAGNQFTQAAHVIHNIAGTAAHEIGHLFDLEHVPAGAQEPYPVMSTGATGLTVSQRLTARRFETTLGTQSDGHSSASLLLAGIGTVNKTDFNMDGTTTLHQDGSIFVSNLGKTDALFQEGDTNNDHVVNVSVDGFAILSSIAQDFTGAAQAEFDPATGEILLTTSGVSAIELISTDAEFLFENATPVGHPLLGSAFADVANSTTINYMTFGTLGIDGYLNRFSLGAVLPVGYEKIDAVQVRYLMGSDEVFASLSLVPEPSSVALLNLAVVPLLRMAPLGRKRSWQALPLIES